MFRVPPLTGVALAPPDPSTLVVVPGEVLLLLGAEVRDGGTRREQLAHLRAEPDGWSNAVEEVLRLDPPVLLTGRTAAVRDELSGPGASRLQ